DPARFTCSFHGTEPGAHAPAAPLLGGSPGPSWWWSTPGKRADCSIPALPGSGRFPRCLCDVATSEESRMSPSVPERSQGARPSWLRGWLGGARALLVLLARGNVLLALGLAATTWGVQVIAGLRAEPLPALITFLVFYSI